MRQKGLVLPGYACSSQIWDSIRVQLDALYDVTWVDWPHELTAGFHSVTAFADWLYPTTRQAHYDFVIGHSMGGLVALELAQREKPMSQKIVLIETFLLHPTLSFRICFEICTSGRLAIDHRDVGSEKDTIQPNFRKAKAS